MDQITHEVRLARWKEAIKQCQSRPEGQSMDPVGFDLFGDRSGIFTEVTGHILKIPSLLKGFLDIDSVFEGQVFWFPGMYLLMYLPSTAVRRRINISLSRKRKSMAPPDANPDSRQSRLGRYAVAEDRCLEEKGGSENLKISVLLSWSEAHRIKKVSG